MGRKPAAKSCCPDQHPCLVHIMNESWPSIFFSHSHNKAIQIGIYELGVNLVAYVAKPLMWAGSEMWSARKQNQLQITKPKMHDCFMSTVLQTSYNMKSAGYGKFCYMPSALTIHCP
jgi:hypothetical protein